MTPNNTKPVTTGGPGDGEEPKGIPSPLPMGSAIRGPIDWNKRVSESNGTAFFIDADYEKRWKAIDKLREEFNAEAVKMAKKEITLNMAVQNFYFDLRNKLDKDGAQVWTKDIGLDPNAIKDGKYVVNLVENGK